VGNKPTFLKLYTLRYFCKNKLHTLSSFFILKTVLRNIQSRKDLGPKGQHDMFQFTQDCQWLSDWCSSKQQWCYGDCSINPLYASYGALHGCAKWPDIMLNCFTDQTPRRQTCCWILCSWVSRALTSELETGHQLNLCIHCQVQICMKQQHIAT